MQICKIEECTRALHARGMCSGHYFRWRVTGVTGGELRKRVNDVPDSCVAPKCTSEDIRAHGLCGMHYQRLRKHGSVEYNGRERYGADHHRWKGEEIGYGGAHERVQSVRGKASEHQCVDCTEQAAEWSYRGGSQKELTKPVKGGNGAVYMVAYSPDLTDYDPRCKTCHKRYDDGRRR